MPQINEMSWLLTSMTSLIFLILMLTISSTKIYMMINLKNQKEKKMTFNVMI